MKLFPEKNPIFQRSRELRAKVVVIHGQAEDEPVAPIFKILLYDIKHLRADVIFRLHFKRSMRPAWLR